MRSSTTDPFAGRLPYLVDAVEPAVLSPWKPHRTTVRAAIERKTSAARCSAFDISRSSRGAGRGYDPGCRRRLRVETGRVVLVVEYGGIWAGRGVRSWFDRFFDDELKRRRSTRPFSGCTIRSRTPDFVDAEYRFAGDERELIAPLDAIPFVD